MLVPMCARCKKVPPEEGKKRCRPCLDYESASVRRAHQNRKNRGGHPGKPGRPSRVQKMLAADIDDWNQ